MKRIKIFHIGAAIWFFIALWAYNAWSTEPKRKPKYELTVVSWYSPLVDKKTQVLDTLQNLTECERRAAGISKEWMGYGEDRFFVGIVLCLERKA